MRSGTRLALATTKQVENLIAQACVKDWIMDFQSITILKFKVLSVGRVNISCHLSPLRNLTSVTRTPGKINSNTYFSFIYCFGARQEWKKDGTSIITKESLFGSHPPQMAEWLMFLSRCVASSLSRMGCVHNHCLRSKIEGKPCKMWMPLAKTWHCKDNVSTHLFFTLETSGFLS